MKYYFAKPPEDEDDFCASLKYWREYMQEHGLTEMELIEAERFNDPEYFYCENAFEIGEKGYCGTICKAYKPRNGKSGICSHYRQLYAPTQKKLILKL